MDIAKCTIFIICIFILISCVYGELNESYMETEMYNTNIYDNLTTKLDIKINENNIIAIVQFVNDSDKIINIPFWYILHEGITNNNFLILNENKDIAKYTGILAKRGEPKDADLIKILPKSKIKKMIILTDVYIIPPNSCELWIKYFVPFKISSNIVKIKLLK